MSCCSIPPIRVGSATDIKTEREARGREGSIGRDLIHHFSPMAVEAPHLNLLPDNQQLLQNRGIVSPIECATNMYTTPMGYEVPTTVTTTEASRSLYNSTMKATSDLTCNLPISRKRSREAINCYNNAFFSFLGEDTSIQILQQQLEIDQFTAQHMEKVRLEIEERRKRHSRLLIAAVEEGIMKRLRDKEEEIERMGKLNWQLEERLKSLSIENQIWKDLAQTNEAAANALRANLAQVLAQAKNVHLHRTRLDEAETDDVESCRGSTAGGECAERGEWRALEENNRNVNDNNSNSGSNRWCRNCGKEESSVLLLPCRHLCLCTVCGSTLHTCPICKSSKYGSVHVNMS